MLKRNFYDDHVWIGSSLFGPDPDGDEIVPQKLWVCQRLRRIATRFRATAIKKVNAKSVLHMAPSPR